MLQEPTAVCTAATAADRQKRRQPATFPFPSRVVVRHSRRPSRFSSNYAISRSTLLQYLSIYNPWLCFAWMTMNRKDYWTAMELLKEQRPWVYYSRFKSPGPIIAATCSTVDVRRCLCTIAQLSKEKTTTGYHSRSWSRLTTYQVTGLSVSTTSGDRSWPAELPQARGCWSDHGSWCNDPAPELRRRGLCHVSVSVLDVCTASTWTCDSDELPTAEMVSDRPHRLVQGEVRRKMNFT